MSFAHTNKDTGKSLKPFKDESDKKTSAKTIPPKNKKTGKRTKKVTVFNHVPRK